MVKSYLKYGNFIYKIGYSDDANIQNRLNQYFYMNPGCEIIGTREGDEKLESLFHRYLYFLGYQFQINGKLSEWFRGEKRVLDLFYIPQETLEQKVWENRDKIFDPSKISQKGLYQLEKDILVYLFLKNQDSFLSQFVFSKLDQRLHKLLIDLGELEIQKPKINTPKEKEVSDFLDNHFYKTGLFREKMKMYCEFMDKHKKDFSPELQDMIYFKIKDERFRRYYNYFGTSGCSALKYQEENLRLGMEDASKVGEIKAGLRNKFEVGKSYSLKDIKFILGNLYRDLGVTKNPKATDLSEYYVLKRVKFSDQTTKKRIEGYLIENYL